MGYPLLSFQAAGLIVSDSNIFLFTLVLADIYFSGIFVCFPRLVFNTGLMGPKIVSSKDKMRKVFLTVLIDKNPRASMEQEVCIVVSFW